MSQGRHSFVAFYPSDWVAGTARMSRLQRSVYFDICCYNWDKVEACPAAELALMLGDIDGWERIVDTLVAAGKLDKGVDGGVSNPRAITEAKKAFETWSKMSNGGKTSAATKKRTKPTPYIYELGKGVDNPADKGGEGEVGKGVSNPPDKGTPPPLQQNQNQNQNHKDTPSLRSGGGPKAKPKEELGEQPELPEWIPKAQWDGYVAHRRKRKAPLVDRARELAIMTLDRLREQGNDPGQVLDQSVMRGWTGLFKLGADFAGSNVNNGNGHLPDDFEGGTPDEWRQRCRVFATRRAWKSTWGPKPGQPQCKVPPEIIQEFTAP